MSDVDSDEYLGKDEASDRERAKMNNDSVFTFHDRAESPSQKQPPQIQLDEHDDAREDTPKKQVGKKDKSEDSE